MPILQLAGFDEVDDPFGDAVFVGGVVFLLEVVFVREEGTAPLLFRYCPFRGVGSGG